jgi:hypothetical protein
MASLVVFGSVEGKDSGGGSGRWRGGGRKRVRAELFFFTRKKSGVMPIFKIALTCSTVAS